MVGPINFSPRLSSFLLTWLGAAWLAFAIYWPALHGPFISDDQLFIVNNPWTATFSTENLLEMFHPWGEARAAANYAPLHLVASAVERQLFWDDTFGYHALNVLIHALNATLLASLLLASGLPRSFALFGGLFFLVHPANVEAVAWISQLKTNGALAFTLGALLSFLSHPRVATALFLAGLLTKASAAAALPMAAALAWSRRGQGSEGSASHSWRWLALWVLLLLLFALPYYMAIQTRGTVEVGAYDDLGVHVRTIASVGTHYLLMAYSGLGVAYQQEYPPVLSLLDPWWIASLPLAVFFCWRIWVALRRRSEEALYWIGAAAGFAPISQIFPFLHPVADRYLYFVLPGLIGGTLILLHQFLESRRASGLPDAWSPMGGWIAIAATAGVLVVFGFQSAGRAHLWSNSAYLLADSVKHFPEGRNAYYLQARQAAEQGDAENAVLLLRKAIELGGDRLHFDPVFRRIAQHPGFREISRDEAGRYIALVSSLVRPTQAELSSLAAAHLVRGEYEEAERALDAATQRGGTLQPELEIQLERLRAIRAARDAR